MKLVIVWYPKLIIFHLFQLQTYLNINIRESFILPLKEENMFHTHTKLLAVLFFELNIIKLNSVVLVRKRTIPIERPQPVGEVSANS
jgi:hypothetical protein